MSLRLYLANLAFNLISSSETRQVNFPGNAALISIFILLAAMAPQQMRLSLDIVNLLWVYWSEVLRRRSPLAFGLGGLEVATGELQK